MLFKVSTLFTNVLWSVFSCEKIATVVTSFRFTSTFTASGNTVNMWLFY